MKKFSKALVNKMYLLEKFEGKGGWTFARIPEVKKDKSRPFGWVRVCGSIDNVMIKGYHLMPMGEGKLFLPVNAEIRKKTGKSAGDRVHIILYPDDKPTEIPPELIDCLQDEPEAFNKFENCLTAKGRHILNGSIQPKQMKPGREGF
jgi:hypothetical protein